MQWLIKIKIEFFTEIEKNKPKFSRNQKKFPNNQINLEKGKELGGFILPNLKNPKSRHDKSETICSVTL